MPRKSMSGGRRSRGRAAKRTSMRARGKRGPLAQSTWQGRRADRVPRGLYKNYTFDFTLTSQVFASSPQTAGEIVVAGSPSGQVPVNGILNFTGTSSTTSSVFANVSDFSGAATHRLTDCGTYNQWCSLFDSYRINSVTVIMEYISSHNVGPVPTLYYYQDLDDAAAPGGLGIISGKQGVQQWQPSANQTMKAFTYRPRNTLAATTSSSAPVLSIISPAGNWIDCTRPDVAHYALKFFVTDMLAQGNPQSVNAWRFTFKYNVSFRSPLACT